MRPWQVILLLVVLPAVVVVVLLWRASDIDAQQVITVETVDPDPAHVYNEWLEDNTPTTTTTTRPRPKVQLIPRARAGVTAVLARIRACESGGDYQAVSKTGKYRGAYQFDQQTWEANGGTGDPAAASPAEQDRVAAALYARRGTAPWPTCGAGV